MEDELELFIRERKERVAQDRASLDLEPPYMEVLAKPHGSYGSLFKENIPPKLTAQKKEESNDVGLPLGLEYEKKKKKLQHELRMDYRRHIAQQNGALKQRPPSRRDVATLTEASKEYHRALSSPESARHNIRREMPDDQESDEEKYTSKRQTEVRCSRQRVLESCYEKHHGKDDCREDREIPSGFVLQGRRSRALNKADEAEFSTGLLIGVIDTEEALQMRKERYREQLQEQIAEHYRNKKREKELELTVAATGANDPEKQPNRIRQFGTSRRKTSRLSGRSMLGQSEESSSTSSSNLPNHGVTDVGGRRAPPPDQPYVAFWASPVYSCGTADPNRGRLSPDRQPVMLPFPRPMETSRTPMIPPHLPHIVSEANKSPFREPYYYYGNRTMLDPHLAYYGHMPYHAVGPHMSYFNMPLEGAVPYHLSDASPQSGSSFPESSPQPNTDTVTTNPHTGVIPPEKPHCRPNTDTVTTNPHTGVIPPEKPQSNRRRTLNYADELKQQILEKQERKRAEREEQERYEAKLEAEMRRLQPWGRGGGGAPLKDHTGNVIADLKQMHKLNEVALSHPEQQERALAMNAACRAGANESSITGHPRHQPNEEAHSNPEQQQSAPSINTACPGFSHVQTPEISNQPTRPQATENAYRAYLDQQIKEKKQKQAEEKERNRLQEEKDARILEEYHATMKRRFEEEQEKMKQKEMEKKAKEEELLNLAKQRKMEEERKKTEEREKAQKKKHEQEQQAQVKVHQEAPPRSPPLQRNHVPHQDTPKPPIAESSRSQDPLPESSLSGHHSPPVPARKNQLRATGNKTDVYSELSALRRQLRAEQRRLETHLQQGDCDDTDYLMTGRKSHQQLDVFEMARLKLQAPVRKPRSRNMEPSSLLRIHDSLQLDKTDGGSRLCSSQVERLERVGVANRRGRVDNDLLQKISSQRSTCTNEYFDTSPPRQRDLMREKQQGSVIGLQARGSLLESDSAFLAPLGDDFPVPSSPEAEETSQLSARERRRLTKQSQNSPERENDVHPGSSNRGEAESSSEGNSQEKMSPESRGNTAGTVDLYGDDDDDFLPPQISRLTHNRQSSMESSSTDLWMRPGTSETLKCLEESVKRDPLTT
ncbi:centrosome and spindle pole-associated protein 1-like isoform X2 [Corythoichthys intestinalis]|uniref:centrosome and spindle pole-associated protein 1-like isoform X2 n=1 Tax=Corythoichthys intestinalis TaxID=161448 RepID=UPI0025A5E00D|nr:centrosome and spindle pole-associated protein 1-like isoform X2 [Corythoichthys intestinalis]